MLCCAWCCVFIINALCGVVGVSLINSLREKWCMGLLSRRSGEKWSLSQNPSSYSPWPASCHFAILCSVNEVLVDLPGDCCLFPTVSSSEHRRRDDTSRGGENRFNCSLLWTPPHSQESLPIPQPALAYLTGQTLAGQSWCRAGGFESRLQLLIRH